jgi:methylmalonyl-CoA mutase
MILDLIYPSFLEWSWSEYAVIGRVARKFGRKRNKYGANERAQMLKYHIQTSGRSLHKKLISMISVLQALYAIYDNCNSLHTNAYDEAITTPTEVSASCNGDSVDY